MSEEKATVVFVTLQVVVFFLAFFGNTVVIIAVCKFIRHRSITYRFIINLAIADMLTGLASLTQVIYILAPSLNEIVQACLFRYRVVICVTLTSQLTVTFTTFDRYLAICHPLSYRRIMTKTVCNILIVMSWIYPFIISSLTFFGVHEMTRSGSQCIFQKVVTRWQLLINSFTLWIFIASTIIMYFFIMKKACKLYRQQRRVSARISRIEDTPTTDGSCTAQGYLDIDGTRHAGNINSLNGAKALAVITLLFVTCWLPHTYFQFRGFLDSDFLDSKEWDIAGWIVFLGMANSVVNPFIYAWKRKDFNMAVKKMLCKHQRRVFVVDNTCFSVHMTRDAWF